MAGLHVPDGRFSTVWGDVYTVAAVLCGSYHWPVLACLCVLDDFIPVAHGSDYACHCCGAFHLCAVSLSGLSIAPRTLLISGGLPVSRSCHDLRLCVLDLVPDWACCAMRVTCSLHVP